MNTWESLIASRNRHIVTCRIESPTKRRAYLSKLAYYKTPKGKQNRKEADARFRENHREERNEYSRNYYAKQKLLRKAETTTQRIVNTMLNIEENSRNKRR